MYVKPWTRVGTYALGAYLGLFMFRFKKIRIPKLLAVFLWLIFIFIGLVVMYIKHFEASRKITPWNRQVKILFETVYRPAWGMCICWIIWSCHNGYGGPINMILSIKYLIPISRLGYGIYLFHSFFIAMFIFSLRDKFFVNHVLIVSKN